MKCAVELNQIVENIQTIQQAQKLAEEMRIQRAIMEARENSEYFCETVIARKLEQVAKKGERTCEIILGLHVNDAFSDMELYGPIEPDGLTYADGTVSMRVVKDKALSVDAIVSYLQKHCYEVFISCDLLPFKEYGCGWQQGRCLRISIPEKTPCA